MPNTAVEKLAPTMPLTDEQNRLVSQILNFSTTYLSHEQTGIFSIIGEAGTGKSVVLSHLFYQIQTAARTNPSSPFYGTRNYFLVNHPEVLKVYKEIAGPIKTLLKKDYQRPTSFINQLDKTKQQSDVVIIDESHLLLSKPDHYNNFYYENQLQEIINRAKIVILVFDPYQVLRMKSFWTTERLQALVASYPHQEYRLKKQFRMSAQPELINWLNDFTNGDIHPLPQNAKQDYDFRIFGDAEAMRQAIVKRNQEVGLSRILSTSGYPSTLDGGKHYICEGNFKMPWDQYNYTSTPWAEISSTIDEVGSIYTCQGFDLNYAGVIIGPVISQVPNQMKLHVNLDRFTDTEAFKRRNDLTDPEQIRYYKERMILNALNVILKRGVQGTYIYAHDPLLRKTLVELDQNLNRNNQQ